MSKETLDKLDELVNQMDKVLDKMSLAETLRAESTYMAVMELRDLVYNLIWDVRSEFGKDEENG